MKHKLKQGIERPYKVLLDDGKVYEGRFSSLRPARKWAKQFGMLTGQGVVLADFENRPVLVFHRQEIKDELHNSRNAYRRSLGTVAIVTGKGFKRRK